MPSINKNSSLGYCCPVVTEWSQEGALERERVLAAVKQNAKALQYASV